MNKFEEKLRILNYIYEPENDIFDDPVQMNHIDKRLLDLIVILRNEMVSCLGIPKEFLDD